MRRGRILVVFVGLVTMCSAFALAGCIASPAVGQRRPVVIVGGTFVGQPVADVYYATLAARLRSDGFSVSVFGLVDNGFADIRTSSAALSSVVDGVLAQAGASKVHL